MLKKKTKAEEEFDDEDFDDEDFEEESDDLPKTRNRGKSLGRPKIKDTKDSSGEENEGNSKSTITSQEILDMVEGHLIRATQLLNSLKNLG